MLHARPGGPIDTEKSAQLHFRSSSAFSARLETNSFEDGLARNAHRDSSATSGAISRNSGANPRNRVQFQQLPKFWSLHCQTHSSTNFCINWASRNMCPRARQQVRSGEPLRVLGEKKTTLSSQKSGTVWMLMGSVPPWYSKTYQTNSPAGTFPRKHFTYSQS